MFAHPLEIQTKCLTNMEKANYSSELPFSVCSSLRFRSAFPISVPHTHSCLTQRVLNVLHISPSPSNHTELAKECWIFLTRSPACLPACLPACSPACRVLFCAATPAEMEACTEFLMLWLQMRVFSNLLE